MTTAERIVAESKHRGKDAIRNKGRKPWMRESEEARIIAFVQINSKAQRNIIARGGIAPAF